MENRLSWVDYAKGMGIILVVYGHVAQGIFSAGLSIDAPSYLLINSIIYSFHMPLFFALAGWFFLDAVKRKGALNQIGSKVNSVFYVFVVWSILHGLIEVGLSKFTNNQLTLNELFTLSNHPRNHLWFLFALFFVSVFCSFIYAFLDRRWQLLIFALGVAMYFVGNSYDISSTPVEYYILGFSVFLMFGVSLAKYSEASWFGQLCSTPLVALTLLLFAWAQYSFHLQAGWTWDEGPVLWRLALALLGVYTLVVFSRWLGQFELGLLAFLGRRSLEIYLMHLIAGSGIRIILHKFLGIDDVTVHLVAGTVFGIVLPLIGAWFIDKLKLGFLFTPPSFLRVPYLSGGR
ncbi:MAG: acyltransferase family protein [Pontibacterium sp.]